jgi:hypothetical protein
MSVTALATVARGFLPGPQRVKAAASRPHSKGASRRPIIGRLVDIAVTLAAARIAAASPRLSYFGVQVAVVFDLINLQEFKMQTSLAVARDHVLGILLGLVMMWLTCCSELPKEALAAQLQTFLSLSPRIESLTSALGKEIGNCHTENELDGTEARTLRIAGSSCQHTKRL